MRIERTRHRAPRPLFDAVRARTLPVARPLAAPVGTVSEVARRSFVRVVLVIYLLAIFEGALRKYVAPQFGQFIFFIRDPFVLYAYVLAARFDLWPRDNGLFKFSVFLCVFGAALFGLQFAFGGYSDTRLVLGAYGWRSYFLYAPLAFVIGEQFRAADLARFMKITLLLAIPIAVLVAAQFFSPMNSPINVGIAEEKELQFKGMGLDAKHIRTTGPFTSTAGLQQFVVTAFGFALACLLMPAARRRLGMLTLLVSIGAILTCVAFSGSRGTMLQCGVAGLFAIGLGVVGRGAALKFKALALPSALGAAAVVLYPIVFPVGFEAFVNRWNNAAKVESGIEGGVFGRALYSFFDFFRLIDVVPTFGYGLGYGSNASIQMRASVDGVMPGLLAETDFTRHMVDLGPLLGIGYIVFRAVLLWWLLRLVLRATRSVSDPLPMMLFAYAGYTVLLGQISGHGSINVYGWLFFGFCIAASRAALQPLRMPVTVGRSGAQPLPRGRLRWAR